MNILKSRYKKILRKINLSSDQLEILKNRLQPMNICSGPFIKGEKMCPNTTALSLKVDEKLSDKNRVRELLNQYGISNLELILFYIVFDIPAMISDSLFEKSLVVLRNSVDEIIKEDTIKL